MPLMPPRPWAAADRAQRPPPPPSRRSKDAASGKSQKKRPGTDARGGPAAKPARRASLSALSAARYSPLLANLAWPAGEESADAREDGGGGVGDHHAGPNGNRGAGAGRNGLGNTPLARLLGFLGGSESDDDDLGRLSCGSTPSSGRRTPPADPRRLTIGVGLSDTLGVARRLEIPPRPASAAGERKRNAFPARPIHSDVVRDGSPRSQPTLSNGSTPGFVAQLNDSAQQPLWGVKVSRERYPSRREEVLEDIEELDWPDSFPDKLSDDAAKRESQVAALGVPEAGAVQPAEMWNGGNRRDAAPFDEGQLGDRAASPQTPGPAVESGPGDAKAQFRRQNTVSSDRVPPQPPRSPQKRTMPTPESADPSSKGNSAASSSQSSPRVLRRNPRASAKTAPAPSSKAAGAQPVARVSRAVPAPDAGGRAGSSLPARTKQSLASPAKAANTGAGRSPPTPRSPEPCSRCSRLALERQEAAELRVQLEIARGQANAHRELAEEAKREAAAAYDKARAEMQGGLEKAEEMKRETEDVRRSAAQAECRLAEFRDALEREREAKEHCKGLYQQAVEMHKEERAEKERLTEEADMARERIYLLEEELHGLQKKEQTDIDMLTRALGHVGKQRDELAASLRTEEHKTARLEDEIDSLLQKVEDVNKRNFLMQEETAQLRRKMEHDSQAEAQVKLLQARLDDAMRELEQVRKRYEHSENQNRVYRTTIQQLLDGKSVSEGRPSFAEDCRTVDQRQSPVKPVSSKLSDMTADCSRRTSLSRSSTISLPTSSFHHPASTNNTGGTEPPWARQAWSDAHSSMTHSSAASLANPGSPRSFPTQQAGNANAASSKAGLEDYMQAARDLELQLRDYTREKEKLQAEYSRIPINGGALARRRQADVEARLDEVDRNLARVKLKMRSMHVM